jgi:mono/diheme cytochrome c family protein
MRIHFAAAAAFGVACVIGTGLTVVSAQSKTVWNGVYTAEQATRGKDKAAQACGSCHGKTLTGGDTAPTLIGEDFFGHWYDAKLTELVQKIQGTMPADAPGSLKEDEYADVIAYMLQAGGFPAGMDPLKIKPESVTDDIKITKSK